MADRKKILFILLIGPALIYLLALSWNSLPAQINESIESSIRPKGIRGVNNIKEIVNLSDKTIKNQEAAKEESWLYIEINDDWLDGEVDEVADMKDLVNFDFVTPFQIDESLEVLETELFKFYTPYDDEVACQFINKPNTQSQFQTQSPKKVRTECKEVESVNPIISVSNNTFKILCPSNQGEYYLSSSTSSQSQSLTQPLNFSSFSTPIHLKTTSREFIFIKCSNTLRSVHLSLKFSLHSSYKSKSKTLSLMQEYSKPSLTPLSVHLILLDSQSRGSFFHSLDSTIAFINQEVINSPDLVAYDFVNTHSQDLDTVSNLLPLLLGANISTHSSRLKSANKPLTDSEYEDIQRAYSIWSHFENFGFVTYASFASVWDLLKEHVGGQAATDHNLIEFWHVARQVFGFSENSDEEKCIGGKNEHRLLFDHLVDFAKAYKGHNKFSVSHAGTMFDSRGDGDLSLDQDLKDTLAKLVGVYRENNENFVLILIGDDERDGGVGDEGEEKGFDRKNSAFFMIASQDVVRLGGKGTHEVLKFNSRRLVSKFDIFLTLMHLAALPYFGDRVAESGIYGDLKKSVQMDGAVSLMAEKISNGRKCKDLMIDEEFCYCGDYENLGMMADLNLY